MRKTAAGSRNGFLERAPDLGPHGDGHGEVEFTLARDGNVLLLTLVSEDGTNRLTRRRCNALREEIESFCGLNTPVVPLVITGDPIFSAGADLNEVSVSVGRMPWHSPGWVRG